MTVQELIEQLQKCPKEWLVMYDAETECNNEALVLMQAEEWSRCNEYDMAIDDVLIGGGSSRGFVFLSAEPYKEV